MLYVICYIVICYQNFPSKMVYYSYTNVTTASTSKSELLSHNTHKIHTSYKSIEQQNMHSCATKHKNACFVSYMSHTCMYAVKAFVSIIHASTIYVLCVYIIYSTVNVYY